MPGQSAPSFGILANEEFAQLLPSRPDVHHHRGLCVVREDAGQKSSRELDDWAQHSPAGACTGLLVPAQG